MAGKERLTINIPAFAELSGISKNLAYSLARQNRLGVKIIHLGKRLLLSRREVMALLNNVEDEKPQGKADGR